jgi:hypothetical protein
MKKSVKDQDTNDVKIPPDKLRYAKKLASSHVSIEGTIRE